MRYYPPALVISASCVSSHPAHHARVRWTATTTSIVGSSRRDDERERERERNAHRRISCLGFRVSLAYTRVSAQYVCVCVCAIVEHIMCRSVCIYTYVYVGAVYTRADDLKLRSGRAAARALWPLRGIFARRPLIRIYT